MARRGGQRSALMGRDAMQLNMMAEVEDPTLPQACAKPGDVKFSKVDRPLMLWEVLTGSVHEHMATVKLQSIWRKKRRRLQLETHEFQKYVDARSGEFYYTKRDDPAYSTWSIPQVVGGLPLQPPEPEFASALRLERAHIASRKLRERWDRTKLVDIVRAKHREERRRAEIARIEAEEAAFQKLWKDAFDFAGESGELNMLNKRTGTIHPYLYEFSKTYGRPLVALRLVAHELTEFPRRVGLVLTKLDTLTLSSNLLTELPDSVCDLIHLKSVNLLRNRLEALPNRLGDLVNLESLQIATNRLQTLPITFGNLTKLDRVIADCNRLRRVPETLSRMTCHTLSFNCNQLVSLPRCLVNMANLSLLSANDNQLKALPMNIGSSKSLMSIKLCANQIGEIPESISTMPKLRALWLDHNKPIAALPWNFYMLTSLVELHMEGNTGMMYPTQAKLIMGAGPVRDWFKRRQKHALFIRRHRIVTTIQDVMEQIVETTPKVTSPAYFEPNVFRSDDHWYQIVMDAFWKDAIPALQDVWDEKRAKKGRCTSLPFQREEIEKVLENYRDAEGRVYIRNQKCYFRRCACVDKRGRRKVCVPPQQGWMCERQADIFKMHVVLQREKLYHDQRKREDQAIEQTLESAPAWIPTIGPRRRKQYCDSEEGQERFHFRAIKQARKEMDQRRKDRWEKSSKLKLDKRVADLQRDHDVKQNLPEDGELAILERDHKIACNKAEQEVYGRGFKPAGFVGRFLQNTFDSEQKELAEELAVDLVKRYTSKEMAKAEKVIREEHEKMRKISAAWAGLGVHDVFKGWKKYTRREASRKDELQWAADCVAAIELAHWNLDKFEKCHDEWSDLPFWRHTETDGIVWDEPTFENLLPPGMQARFPHDLPVDDPHGWEEVLTEQALAQHGGDVDVDLSSESASEAFTDLSSDHGGDEDGSGDLEQPSLLTGDEPPPSPGEDGAAVVVAGEAGTADGDEAEEVESESEDSDEPELLVWDEDEAPLPATRDALALLKLEQATIRDPEALRLRGDEEKARRLEDAREGALERARMRRKIKFNPKKYKEHKETAAEKAIKAAKGALSNLFGTNTDDRPETEQEVMARTGFQPGVNYTDAELTVFAKQAARLCKKYGISEHDGDTVVSDGTSTVEKKRAQAKKDRGGGSTTTGGSKT
ncbi:hypothetical protein JL720_2381 [Aureococcus anophagefferens]|nr:hypothetical protein JL720_2381 [Aureococcus anophagefferens]